MGCVCPNRLIILDKIYADKLSNVWRRDLCAVQIIFGESGDLDVTDFGLISSWSFIVKGPKTAISLTDSLRSVTPLCETAYTSGSVVSFRYSESISS